MKYIDKEVKCNSRSDVFEIYPIGDVHLGARNCAEKYLKRHIKEIEQNPNAFWFGCGDLLDCIKPQDKSRYDVEAMPDWMFEGDAMTVREKLSDILSQQFGRLVELLQPIAHKGLVLIEGNHEYDVHKYHNDNIHQRLCNMLDIPNGTDECVMRLRFKRLRASKTIRIYACHGKGGGRTPGAEPNWLHRLRDEWEDAEVCFRGHSHICDELPPKPVLIIPRSGKLPREVQTRYRLAANWGCWVLSHAVGPSTYASRACYPARPLATVKLVIQPFYHTTKAGQDISEPQMEIRRVLLI